MPSNQLHMNLPTVPVTKLSSCFFPTCAMTSSTCLQRGTCHYSSVSNMKYMIMLYRTELPLFRKTTIYRPQDCHSPCTNLTVPRSTVDTYCYEEFLWTLINRDHHMHRQSSVHRSAVTPLTQCIF